MSTTTIPQWVIKGITDDCTTCECCGRQNLKRTVALAPLDCDGNEDGDPVYYGTSCAAVVLRRTQTWISTTAKVAAIHHRERDNTARRIISVYAPVEFATTREKAAAWFSRNSYRAGRPGASSEIERLLSDARTQLQDTTLGPARPYTMADFRPHLIVRYADHTFICIGDVPADATARKAFHAAAGRQAGGGQLLTVYALDDQSAEEVAYAQHARAQYLAARGTFH